MTLTLKGTEMEHVMGRSGAASAIGSRFRNHEKATGRCPDGELSQVVRTFFGRGP
jgi:hypothetical protein